jgi:hypothetical protein
VDCQGRLSRVGGPGAGSLEESYEVGGHQRGHFIVEERRNGPSPKAESEQHKCVQAALCWRVAAINHWAFLSALESYAPVWAWGQ